jgi:hypothetical protein
MFLLLQDSGRQLRGTRLAMADGRFDGQAVRVRRGLLLDAGRRAACEEHSRKGDRGVTQWEPTHYMQLPEEHGPLITGAWDGAASGAGIRFWKVAIGGVGAPKRAVGLRKL